MAFYCKYCLYQFIKIATLIKLLIVEVEQLPPCNIRRKTWFLEEPNHSGNIGKTNSIKMKKTVTGQ